MGADQYTEIVLNELPKITGLSEGKTAHQIECCIWCILKTNKENGCVLLVEDLSERERYTVIWDNNSYDKEKVERSLHRDEAVELGAEAIALVLAIMKTDYDSVRRSKKGKGDDYRLAKKGARLFQGTAKLEISGILEANKGNSLNRRVREKLEQVSKGNKSIPGCVIVVEFGKLMAKVAWNNE